MPVIPDGIGMFFGGSKTEKQPNNIDCPATFLFFIYPSRQRRAERSGYIVRRMDHRGGMVFSFGS
jgi:hypothetical protein